MERREECAKVIAASARAIIMAMGMQAENQMREHRGEAPAYVYQAFDDLIVETGIDHNSVISRLTL